MLVVGDHLIETFLQKSLTAKRQRHKRSRTCHSGVIAYSVLSSSNASMFIGSIFMFVNSIRYEWLVKKTSVWTKMILVTFHTINGNIPHHKDIWTAVVLSERDTRRYVVFHKKNVSCGIFFLQKKTNPPLRPIKISIIILQPSPISEHPLKM